MIQAVWAWWLGLQPSAMLVAAPVAPGSDVLVVQRTDALPRCVTFDTEHAEALEKATELALRRVNQHLLGWPARHKEQYGREIRLPYDFELAPAVGQIGNTATFQDKVQARVMKALKAAGWAVKRDSRHIVWTVVVFHPAYKRVPWWDGSLSIYPRY